jgi:hypothetical protein
MGNKVPKLLGGRGRSKMRRRRRQRRRRRRRKRKKNKTRKKKKCNIWKNITLGTLHTDAVFITNEYGMLIIVSRDRH